MDDEIVDLSGLCVHQDRATVAADIIHRVRAGDEDRWRTDDVLRAGRRNTFQRDSRMLLNAHDALPCRREFKHSQPPKPDIERVGDGTIIDLSQYEI
jgi:hypothetical protein